MVVGSACSLSRGCRASCSCEAAAAVCRRRPPLAVARLLPAHAPLPLAPVAEARRAVCSPLDAAGMRASRTDGVSRAASCMVPAVLASLSRQPGSRKGTAIAHQLWVLTGISGRTAGGAAQALAGCRHLVCPVAARMAWCSSTVLTCVAKKETRDRQHQLAIFMAVLAQQPSQSRFSSGGGGRSLPGSCSSSSSPTSVDSRASTAAAAASPPDKGLSAAG